MVMKHLTKKVIEEFVDDCEASASGIWENLDGFKELVQDEEIDLTPIENCIDELRSAAEKAIEAVDAIRKQIELMKENIVTVKINVKQIDETIIETSDGFVVVTTMNYECEDDPLCFVPYQTTVHRCDEEGYFANTKALDYLCAHLLEDAQKNHDELVKKWTLK